MSKSGDLARRRCVSCDSTTPRLGVVECEALLDGLHGWEIVEGHHLARDFRFRDFRAALAFVNGVGEIAEAEKHHPDIRLAWGRARIEIWTHAIDGLSENDFILAAKIDCLG